MEEELVVAQVIFLSFLVGFGVWFSRLSMQMGQAIDGIEGSDEQLEEIREMITQVATVLNHLPELMPQFAIQNSPTEFLKPIVEAFVGSITGQPALKTVQASQGVDGRFDGSQTENEIKTT